MALSVSAASMGNTLAVAIYAKRKALGSARYQLSLRDAAEQVGVSASTLSRIETGGVPDILVFRALCVWLGMSADELLGLKDS